MKSQSMVRLATAICMCVEFVGHAHAKKFPPFASTTLKDYVQPRNGPQLSRVFVEIQWEGPEQKQVQGWQLVTSDLPCDEGVAALKRAHPGSFHGGEWLRTVTLTPEQMAPVVRKLSEVIDISSEREPDRAWAISLVDLSNHEKPLSAETKATPQELQRFLPLAAETIRSENPTAAEQLSANPQRKK